MRELTNHETKNVNGGALFLVPFIMNGAAALTGSSNFALAAGVVSHLAIRGAAAAGMASFFGREK